MFKLILSLFPLIYSANSFAHGISAEAKKAMIEGGCFSRETCLVPFLYAVSIKLEKGGDFYMGELAHGLPGILDDYRDLFGIESNENIIKTLELIGTKKRIANKAPCPCSCGKRLGKCKLRFVTNRLRKTASRSWFKSHAKNPAIMS